MALYRKIKGQDTKVASNGIIYHNDLEGRNSYGAHSIDSIRKLPEKLTELKSKSKANEEAITQEISNREQAIASEAEARNEAIAQEARLRESADTNLSNNINNVRSDTERINLEEDRVNRGKLIFTPAVGDPITVQGGFPPDNTSIILTNSNQLQAKGLVTQTGYLSGDVIKEVISAQGGYLDSHDFGTSTPTNQELTDYAIQNIGTITQADEIWDKTRVINLYDHHTWVWNLSSKTWSDLGKIAQISDANNDGLHGLVTGAPNDGDHDYMGNIDANGQININGLPELAQQVENNTNNISINAQNISTNTSDIATNTSNITTNTQNISTNTSNIATNATNISNNTTAINNEVTNRQNADSNLQSQINQLDTNKQDKLTAGEHIDITNNVINTKDVITLGTETQTFEGAKEFITGLRKSIAFSSSNTPGNGITLNPDQYNILVKGIGVGFCRIYPDRIKVNEAYDLYLPQKSGTLALTSDIPDTSNFVDLNTTTQTFDGNKILNLDYGKTLKFRYSDNNYITIYPNNGEIQISRGASAHLKTTYSGGRIQQQGYTMNFPTKDGTFALTSDIPTLKTFTNTSVSQADWVVDSTYTDYGYKATITLSGVTADMIPQVIFGATEATSGNYLPIAESFAGGIYIYSKVNDAITIPTIIVQKAV